VTPLRDRTEYLVIELSRLAAQAARRDSLFVYAPEIPQISKV